MIYEALDPNKSEIRLLQLLPGVQDSDIQVTLEHGHAYHSDVIYEALSYTWGDPNITTDIEIVSQSGLTSVSTTFKATLNLASALRNLRSPTAVRTLWIDAICINQEDNAEKGHQVNRMGDIFSKAERVIVYLGEGEDFSDEAMMLVSQDPQDLKSTFDLMRDDRWITAWRAMTKLVQRPYFSRQWIVQEVALARDIIIVCGSLSCEWASFMLIVKASRHETYVYSRKMGDSEDVTAEWTGNALKDWEVPGEYFYAWFHGVRNITIMEQARESCWRLSLKNLLATMRGRNVTDVRDGVYSMLGMAKDVRLGWYDVTYDIQPVDCFLDVTENIIRYSDKSENRLDIICHSQWSEDHEHGCSWVPRYAGGFGNCECDAFLTNSLTISEILMSDRGAMSEIMIDHSPYTASKDSEPTYTIDKAARSLTVKGIVIDKVTNVLELPRPFRGGLQIPKQWKEEAMAFESIGAAPMSEDVRNAVRLDAFWRVLVANRDQIELDADDLGVDFRTMADFNDILDFDPKLLQQYRNSAPIDWGNECREWMEGNMVVPDTSTNGFLKGIVAYIRSKRYILMERSMGLAPEATQEDDIVCILFGCSVPVILRHSVRVPGSYHLVGEAYVHGAMDGEIIAAWKAENKHRETAFDKQQQNWVTSDFIIL